MKFTPSRNIAAPISSGSFKADGMIVSPCSMKTLSAIVNSHSDNLLTRAADVMLKEGRRLVLMPRESPLHLGHTELLTRAARLGAIVAPPVPAFYNAPSTVDDIINHSVGRALDLFGIDAGIVKRWAGPRTQVGDWLVTAVLALLHGPEICPAVRPSPLSLQDREARARVAPTSERRLQ